MFRNLSSQVLFGVVWMVNNLLGVGPTTKMATSIYIGTPATVPESPILNSGWFQWVACRVISLGFV